MFSSANILQIADVVLRVAFLLFCYVFTQKLAYSFLVIREKRSAILYPQRIHHQNNLTSSPGLLCNG